MVAKNEIKRIRSLHQKKYRSRHGLFLAEGVKLVEELLRSGWQPTELFSTEPLEGISPARPISEEELKKVSSLVQPNKVLGIFEIPTLAAPDFRGWLLALDGVRDPGNLGTIIRLCDWFGIRDLICSPDTVDCYNPKVVQASMGSLSRVKINYLDLPDYLSQTNRSIYGTFMEGESLYSTTFEKDAILVMVNEANGISEEVRK